MKKQQPIIFLSLVLCLCVILLGTYFKVNFDNAQYQAEIELESIKELQWSFIEQRINALNDHANGRIQVKANDVKKILINNNIKPGFVDRQDTFSKELISSVIQSDYFNNVAKNGNNIFVATQDGIFLDFDPALAPIDGGRDWESEIQRSYNVNLASQAVDSLLNKDNDNILFYEPLKNNNVQDHIIISIMSLEEMKKVYLVEGIDGLCKYQVLTPYHLNLDSDIFDVPDVSLSGEKNNNDKLIIIQRWNIVDQIFHSQSSQNYMNKLQQKEDQILKDLQNDLATRTLQMILICSIFVILILVFIIYLNLNTELKKRGGR